MDLEQAIQIRKRYEAQFAQEQVVTIGKIVARNGSTIVPGVFDHNWVLPFGVGEPVAVYNREVKARRVNMGVQIGFAPYSTILEILRTDPNSTAGVVPTAGLDVGYHAPSHWPEGDDPLYIKDRAFLELLTYSSNQEDLSVRVTDYVYPKDGDWVQFPGVSSLPMSEHLPAAVGTARWVLVYLDTAINEIGTVAGATFPDSRAIVESLPALPIGGIASAFVRVANGQDIFEEPQDFIDARDFLGGGHASAAAKSVDLSDLARATAAMDLIITRHIVEG